MRLATLSALLFASVASVCASDAATSEHHSNVLDLTATNFDETIAANDLMLVEFFAPWCGHCKSLAPRYEEAANALKTRNIPLAKVDCVDQSELCKTQRVGGYPTLRIFKKGESSEYNGARDTEGIVTHMIKQSLPAISAVNAAEHSEFQKGDKVVVILYASETTTGFTEYADRHREEFLFGHATDSAVAEAAGVSQPAIVVYRSFDDFKTIYPQDASTIDEFTFGGWLKELAVPLLEEVTGENYSVYADTERPLAYVFVDPIDENKQAIIDSFKPLAKQYQGKINFAWIDANRFAEHGKSMNLVAGKWPAFVIQDVKQALKFPYDQNKEFSAEAIAPFIADVAAGKISASLRSQPIPEKQDGPVFVLVTKQFDEIVFDVHKDVLIEFYAPWCGHCKRLAPIYDQLGERFASVRDLVTIAKMDATENDVPPRAPFRVQGFPTIKFKPALSHEFIDFDGDRTLEGFTEFIQKHGTSGFVLPPLTETASTSEAVESPVATPAGEKPAQEHIEL